MMSNYKPTKIKWAEYNRKSSEEGSGKQNVSIPRQHNELEEKFPNSVYKRSCYFQESHSAYKPNNRPEFNKLIKLIEEDKITGLIVFHPNRLSRNPTEAGKITQLILDGKIKDIKFATYTFDNSAEGILLLQFALSQSQYESSKLSDHVRSGNKHKFQKKRQWGGPAKPGYLNHTDPLTKDNTIISDPERFQPIKNAFHLMIYKGYTPMQALNTLNEKWHFITKKTLKLGGKPLSRASWYKMITDPFYAGTMRRKVGKEILEISHTHEAMITPHEFEQLQIRLGRKGKPHYTKHQLPYKVIKCGECGGGITASDRWHITCSKCNKKFAKGKRTEQCPKCKTYIDQMDDPKLHQYTHYECINKKKGNGCSQGSLNIEDIEKKIDEELSRYEIPQEFADWAIQYLNEVNTTEEEQDTQAKKALQRQYTSTDQQLKNLIRLRISPNYINFDEEQKSMYDDEEKRLIKIKKKLKQEIEEADQKQEEWIELAKDTFDFVSHARYWFEHGSVEEKTYVLEKLGSNLLAFDKQLLIDGQKAYFLIEKGKKECLQAAEKFESTKSPQLSGEMLDLEPVRLAWRR